MKKWDGKKEVFGKRCRISYMTRVSRPAVTINCTSIRGLKHFRSTNQFQTLSVTINCTSIRGLKHDLRVIYLSQIYVTINCTSIRGLKPPIALHHDHRLDMSTGNNQLHLDKRIETASERASLGEFT